MLEMEIQDNASPMLLKIALIIVMLLSIVSQTFCVSRVTGISMQPTIHDNSIVILSKNISIEHGDIIIFEGNNYGVGNNIIKRVIALPSDRVTIKNGLVLINGDAQEEPYLTKGTQTDGDVELIVRNGEYFVLGDNREVSLDSRELGLIKRKDIIAVMEVVL